MKNPFIQVWKDLKAWFKGVDFEDKEEEPGEHIIKEELDTILKNIVHVFTALILGIGTLLFFEHHGHFYTGMFSYLLIISTYLKIMKVME